jgi:hypothetical protein
MVIPADVTGCSETGRINGKIYFHAGKGQAALSNQFEQNWGNTVILEVIENRIVAGESGDHAAPMGFAEIAHETATGEAGIDLERRCEYGITQGQAGASSPLDWFLNARAEITKQFLKGVLLARLGCIVGAPILRIRFALRNRDCFGNCSAAVWVLLMHYEIGHGIYVFAGHLPFFVVRTRANRSINIGKINKVTGVAVLGWNEPSGCAVLL